MCLSALSHHCASGCIDNVKVFLVSGHQRAAIRRELHKTINRHLHLHPQPTARHGGGAAASPSCKY
eukprot:m.221755 g.221755  ORF g.221755 m.221755 type:complete len:66 (-) comp72237_c0_seq1:58-255(-)